MNDRTRILVSLPSPIKEQFCSDQDRSFDEIANQNWQVCVGYAQEIVDVFRHWNPSYFECADPMISSAVWLTCCILSLQIMNTSMKATESMQPRLESALDLLSMALKRFSIHWCNADMLLGTQIMFPCCLGASCSS